MCQHFLKRLQQSVQMVGCRKETLEQTFVDVGCRIVVTGMTLILKSHAPPGAMAILVASASLSRRSMVTETTQESQRAQSTTPTPQMAFGLVLRASPLKCFVAET
jgi:hypothetical protein